MFKWQYITLRILHCIVFNFFFHGTSGSRPSRSRGFMIILRHTTLPTTPLEERSAGCRDSTWQHTTRTRDKHLCYRRDLNPQFRSMDNCLCCSVFRTLWSHVPCNNKDFAKLCKNAAKGWSRIIFKKVSMKISAWLSRIFWTYRGMKFLSFMLLPSSCLMVPRNFVIHLPNCTVFIARRPIFDSLSARNFGRH